MGFKKHDLLKNFEVQRQEASGETLEQLRANYYIGALMNETGDKTVGGININASGRTNNIQLEKKKAKRSLDDMVLMNIINEMSLPDFESMMAGKYGDDFAENLAAEYLEPDVYKEIMTIDDPEERRKAIAEALNEGIANGTIDHTNIYANPDFKYWLEKRGQQNQLETAQDQAFDSEDINLVDDVNDRSNTDLNDDLQDSTFSAFGRPPDFS